MDGPAVGMFPPPAWANIATPSYAGTKCGDIVQTEQYTTESFTPLAVGFTTPATWSDTESFTPSDPSGTSWVCNTTGIYSLKFTQHLRITNPPAEPVTVGESPIIPWTQFYLNLAAGGPDIPYTGTADVIPEAGSFVQVQAEALEPTLEVLMVTYTTPVGFLSSTVIPGGPWIYSMWASTNDNTESNSLYTSLYSVDADGESNPVLISDGFANKQVLTYNSGLPYNYIWSSTFTPLTILADTTKRIQIRVLIDYGAASICGVYSKGVWTANVMTNLQTTFTVPTVVPIVKDTVNMRMTIASATTEFNQVFETSIPITLVADEILIYTNSVSCMANVDVGSSVVCEIVAEAGLCQVESGFVQLPSPLCTLQWNLIAQGAYGNVGVIV